MVSSKCALWVPTTLSLFPTVHEPILLTRTTFEGICFNWIANEYDYTIRCITVPCFLLFISNMIWIFLVIHCEVSKWSMWSTCDRSCGKGIQSRTRLITQHPSPGGKRCPALSQKRACLGNRCSAKYKKYKSPIVGKNRELNFIGIYFTGQLSDQNYISNKSYF